MKQKYIPPEMEDFDLEMESQILQSSAINEDDTEVETVGQDIEEPIKDWNWKHEW